MSYKLAVADTIPSNYLLPAHLGRGRALLRIRAMMQIRSLHAVGHAYRASHAKMNLRSNGAALRPMQQDRDWALTIHCLHGAQLPGIRVHQQLPPVDQQRELQAVTWAVPRGTKANKQYGWLQAVQECRCDAPTTQSLPQHARISTALRQSPPD